MRHRTTLVLFVLFVTAVGVLWWADYAGVPTREQRQRMLNRVLPELIDTPAGEIERIEVERNLERVKGRVVVERRGERSWQIVEPVDTAADPELVEVLVKNLKDLSTSPDAGTIEGDPEKYGRANPEVTVKVFGKDRKAPLASFDMGKAVKDRVYVRAKPGPGIEVVEFGLLSLLTVRAEKWRDTAMCRIPSFSVKEVSVKKGSPDLTIALERAERHWRMISPIRVPADDDKAEALVAEISALRVHDGEGGFVADDVKDKDLAQYGLDAPSMTVKVTPVKEHEEAQTVKLGKPVPEHAEEVYAMRGDQNDVVRLDVKRLLEAVPGANALRSQKVLEFDPAKVERMVIDVGDRRFDLARAKTGWRLLGPDGARRGHTRRSSPFWKRLSDLKTSEFFSPEKIANARLDAPTFRIRGWDQEGPRLDSVDAAHRSCRAAESSLRAHRWAASIWRGRRSLRRFPATPRSSPSPIRFSKTCRRTRLPIATARSCRCSLPSSPA